MISHISTACGARVLSVDYRRVPRHSIADGISDGIDAYRSVLASGTAPRSVVLAGDSAGGYLAAGWLAVVP